MNDQGWTASWIGGPGGMPRELQPNDRIEYQLNGDQGTYVAERADELAWGLTPYEPGSVARWRKLVPAGVGDVNGTEKGSGARFNGEKPDLSLIPAGILADYYKRRSAQAPRPAGMPIDWTVVLDLLHGFQMRTVNIADALFGALLAMDNDGKLWADCARVFSYGKVKYAAWNWARGMAWSIPLACAMRHIVFGELMRESIDPESGLPHRGHVACNIVMLLWFLEYYPEGDDRPELPHA